MVAPTNQATSNGSTSKHRYAMLALVFAGVVVCVLLIAVFARERIAANERAWFLSRLAALVPDSLHDNDLYTDRVVVSAIGKLGAAPTYVYRARREGKPIAAILTITARDGYGGNIEMLLAVEYSGRILGVDIMRHNETPGIGDGFAPHRSSWLRRLLGRSLDDPTPDRWTIRQDGGAFEQFTGASVTPRAILKAIRLALEYYAGHREALFNAPSANIDQ
jgi:Na+-translocating ferredoxin:NAD+ oxidoreductase subunit G